MSKKNDNIILYADWIETVPDHITNDHLWKMKVYRLALFIGDITWEDITKLANDKRTVALSNQLSRAIGSISANIAEGYSRRTGRDRARFYEYSLGSARESRDWLYKGRMILGETITNHRMEIISEIIKLLLKMIPQQRQYNIQEADAEYSSDF